jgi:predicted transcriptional regulator
VALSAAKNGLRVLVVASSHAASDAATLAILQHWPVNDMGEPHKGNLVCYLFLFFYSIFIGRHSYCQVRYGAELRLTVPALRPFLHSHVHWSGREERVKAQRKLRAIWAEIIDSEVGSPGRASLIKSEQEVIKSIMKEKNKLASEVLSGANIAVCTNFAAQENVVFTLLQQGLFDLVCIDEVKLRNIFVRYLESFSRIPHLHRLFS